MFLLLSGLKPNKSLCETADIGILKGVSLALCGMNCIDLTPPKICGIHFSYNKKFETEKNFIKHVRKIEKVLKKNAKFDCGRKNYYFQWRSNGNYQRTKQNTKIIYLEW